MYAELTLVIHAQDPCRYTRLHSHTQIRKEVYMTDSLLLMPTFCDFYDIPDTKLLHFRL